MGNEYEYSINVSKNGELTLEVRRVDTGEVIFSCGNIEEKAVRAIAKAAITRMDVAPVEFPYEYTWSISNQRLCGNRYRGDISLKVIAGSLGRSYSKQEPSE
jgi:hypothetical protein